MTRTTDRHLVVVGSMGIGKSTLAQAVADHVGRAHRDSDVDIRRLCGRDGNRVAEDLGVPALHRIEAAVLLGALAHHPPQVISAAASTVADDVCRAAMGRRALVVVLHLDLTRLLERIATGDHRRPVDRDELRRLRDERAPWFDEVVDLDLDASDPPDVLRDQILRVWRPASVSPVVPAGGPGS